MRRKFCVLTVLLLSMASTGSTQEQPVKDEGNIFFEDIPQNRILKWSQYGNLSTYLENSKGGGGLFFDKNGDPLTGSGTDRQLISINPHGKATVLGDKYDYEHLKAPHDLWIDPKGGIYFIHTSFVKRNNPKSDKKYVYYLYPDRKRLIRVVDNIVNPDSLVGSPDGKKIFVITANVSESCLFTINEDGTLSNKKIAAREPCEKC